MYVMREREKGREREREKEREGETKRERERGEKGARQICGRGPCILTKQEDCEHEQYKLTVNSS